MPSQSANSLGYARHAFGIALLLVVAVLVHREALFARAGLADERAYVCAAHAAAEGRVLAGCDRYLYGPALAWVGSQLVRHGGELALLATLRSAVWLGAVLTLWMSLALTRFSFASRVIIASLALCLWPPVQQALSLGNLSSAVAALTIGALLLRERRAFVAALLLAAAIVIKPLPAAMPAVFVAAALGAWWREKRVERALLTIAFVSGALVGIVFWLSGGLPVAAPFNPAAENPITLVRLLATLGMPVPPLALFTLVTAAGALIAAARPRRGYALAGLAIVVSLLSSPLVWCHTWLLATPLMALAADEAVARHRATSAGTRERSHALLHLLVVFLLVLVLSVSDALGAALHGTPLSALIIALPLCAPALLLGYWENKRFSTASSQGVPQPHSSNK